MAYSTAHVVAMAVAQYQFPPNIEVFQMPAMQQWAGGETVFPFYDPASGLLAPRCAVYVMKEGTGAMTAASFPRESEGIKEMGGGWFAKAVEFGYTDDPDQVMTRISAAVGALQGAQ